MTNSTSCATLAVVSDIAHAASPSGGCGHGELLLDLTLRLSAKERECDSWRLVALASLAYASDKQREIDMIDERSYIVRTRTQDMRDVWLDQTDIRRGDA